MHMSIMNSITFSIEISACAKNNLWTRLPQAIILLLQGTTDIAEFQNILSLDTRRIGKVQHRGPGAHRSHKRGKRSCEPQAAHRARNRRPAGDIFQSVQDSLACLHARCLTANMVELLENKKLGQSLIVWHLNIQGLRSSVVELVARTRLAVEALHILCLT